MLLGKAGWKASCELIGAVPALLCPKTSDRLELLNTALVESGLDTVGFVIPDKGALVQRHDGSFEVCGDGQVVTEKLCCKWHTQLEHRDRELPAPAETSADVARACDTWLRQWVEQRRPGGDSVVDAACSDEDAAARARGAADPLLSATPPDATEREAASCAARAATACNTGASAFKRGRWAEALRSFNEAVQLGPRDDSPE
eukprot:726979-Prymnesium_polylepis.1